MNLFLCGKGEAAEQILQQLAAGGHRVAVYTHEDERIIDIARRCDFWSTTRSVNDVAVWPYHPVAIASIGYLTIIKPPVIEAMKGRVFNCHAALLPRHRGRSSVPWAIIDGDDLTGITYHWVDAGIDTGNVLLQAVCQIDPNETQASLFEKINRLMVDYWPAAIKLALMDFPGVKQVGAAQYHHPGPPHGGVIDPSWPYEYVDRFIRAMTFPPRAYAKYDGREVRTIDDYERMRRDEREWSL